MTLLDRVIFNTKKVRVAFLAVSTVSLLVCGIIPSLPPEVTAGTGFGEYRMKISFNTTGILEPLNCFPVHIHLDDTLTYFWNHVNSNHSDIRFIDADEHTELYFEIEHWGYLGETADIWVNVTQIDASNITDCIYLYYGNHSASPSPHESSHQVWDTYYAGVWHLNEDTGILHDSTSNNYNGTPQGNPTYHTEGKINGGMTFDGHGDCITYGNIYGDLSAGKLLTMEAWFKLNNLIQDQVILGKNDGGTLPFGLQIFPGTYSLTIYGGDTADGYRSHTATWVPDTDWHYIVGIINGSTLQAYLDGINMGTSPRNNDNILTNTADFIIGWQNITGYTRDMNGTLDEIRISTTLRSSNWITATYSNINNTLLTFGPEEDVTPPTISNIQDTPDPQVTHGPVNITCTVTDNEPLNSVKVHIVYPDTSTVNMTMTHIPLTNIYYHNTTYTPTGTYTYFIWAADTTGNTCASSTYSFTIQEPVAAIALFKTVKKGSTWATNITTTPGHNLQFKITATNMGTTTLTNIEITDTLPIILRYNYDANPIPTASSNNHIEWALGTPITPGSTIIVTYTTSVIATGNGYNNATVTCSQGAHDIDNVSIISIPDGNDTTPPFISIDKPSRYLYIADRAIMPTLWKPIILGGVTIEAIAMDDQSGIDHVEFIINNDIKAVDYTWPYEWFWDEISFGLYTIKAKAYNNAGNTDMDTLSVYIINF